MKLVHTCPLPGAPPRRLWLKNVSSGSRGGDGGIHAGEGHVRQLCGSQSELQSPHPGLPTEILTCVTGWQGTDSL